VLTELEIPIIGRHTGGSAGRTMVVELADCQLDIRMAAKNIITL
jgi:chemotaxis protein CheD